MKPLVAIVGVLAVTFAHAQQPPADVEAAVRAYGAGDRTTALSALERATAGTLTTQLERSIAGGAAADQSRRALAATTLAIDAVWTTSRALSFNQHRTNYDSWGRVTPGDPVKWSLRTNAAQGHVAAWVVRQSTRLPASDSRRRLLLAAIGVLEDASAWHHVNEVLPLLRAALPNEPRVRLLEVLAESYREAGSLRAPGARRLDVLRDEDLPSSGTRPIPRLQAKYDALASDPVIGGEALIRAGYLDLRRRDWKAALVRFEHARTRQTEPVLTAAADYFLGWTYARVGDSDAAIAAYRRALAITPTMRNLATELSALLFLRNERTEAHAILDRAFNAEDIPQDFMMIIERADARFVEDHLRALREGLR